MITLTRTLTNGHLTKPVRGSMFLPPFHPLGMVVSPSLSLRCCTDVEAAMFVDGSDEWHEASEIDDGEEHEWR